MNQRYKGYFRTHYGASFSKADVDRDRQWFFRQFRLIKCLLPNLDQSSKILEVGSGFGGLFSYLNSKNYLGIDMDPEVVDFANAFFKTDRFKNTSLKEFKTNDCFDFVFAVEVLEHFENPLEDIAKIFKLLNNKGKFVGTTPYPFKKNIDADKTHNFVLHPENWQRLFLNEGFSDFRFYPMSFFPFIWRVNKSINLRIPFYVPFKYFISTTLIIAEK